MDSRKRPRRDYFLPQDLVADILQRMISTVATAARFSCTCKSWRRLLSDPKFIHRQLYEDGGEDPVVMITQLNLRDTRLFHNYSLLSYDTLLPKTTPYNSHEGLPCLYIRAAEIIGCCNGLFCIAHKITWPEASVDLGLWNPSTSETMLLPNSRNRRGSMYVTSGFGFDSGTGDYKVVRIIRGNKHHYPSVWVYSLRNGSWTEINGAKHKLKEIDSTPRVAWMHHKLSGEKIYWYSLEKNYITCFDFREERFRQQVFPAGLVKRAQCSELHLAATSKEDSLMAVFRDKKDDNFEIWGLLRYRSVESWTKLFRCNGGRILRSIGVQSRVIGVSGSGEHIIVKANSELLKVDFTKKKVSGHNRIRPLGESCTTIERYVFKTYSYVPSQVSIHDLAYLSRLI
ncbi:F-box protein CPR1 [Linum grandiflorum]